MRNVTEKRTGRSALRGPSRRYMRLIVVGIMTKDFLWCLRFPRSVGRQMSLVPLHESICCELARIALLLHFSGGDSHGK